MNNSEYKQKKQGFHKFDELNRKWVIMDKAIGVIDADIKKLIVNKERQWDLNEYQAELNERCLRYIRKLTNLISGLFFGLSLVLGIELYRFFLFLWG